MSAFLGHIHFWLYSKIQLVNERETLLFHQASEVCGDTAEELRSLVWQAYGTPPGDTPLEDLIDTSNIHGWLQRQIHLAQSREAAFIKELLDSCDNASEWIQACFAEHGEACGNAAKLAGKYDTASAEGIFTALSDYRLNGMPCDQSDELVEESAASVIWQSAENLAEVNWKRAGIAVNVMDGFYEVWLNAFVKAMNPAFTCRQTARKTDGQSVDRFEIAK
ncbi:MAG: hypothetical protein E6713_13015 [Sporomusaceae bacterium]|nr:hypothetical protein [Sporomusaceae bacterium]